MRIICVEPGAEIKPSNGTLQSLINLEQKTKTVKLMCHSDNTRNSCIILSRFGASSQNKGHWIDREQWKYDGKKLLFVCSEIQGGKQGAQRRKAKI